MEAACDKIYKAKNDNQKIIYSEEYQEKKDLYEQNSDTMWNWIINQGDKIKSEIEEILNN